MKKIQTKNLIGIFNKAGVFVYSKDGDLLYFINKKEVKEIKEILYDLPHL